jgi:hypothetical protein
LFIILSLTFSSLLFPPPPNNEVLFIIHTMLCHCFIVLSVMHLYVMYNNVYSYPCDYQ